MTKIFGVILILLGIALGGYVGLYLCLYGGIVQIIEGVKNSFDAVPMAIGLVRVLCTTIAFWIGVLLLAVPGWALITND